MESRGSMLPNVRSSQKIKNKARAYPRGIFRPSGFSQQDRCLHVGDQKENTKRASTEALILSRQNSQEEIFTDFKRHEKTSYKMIYNRRDYGTQIQPPYQGLPQAIQDRNETMSNK